MFELVKTASFISPAKPFTWKDLAGMKPYCAVVAGFLIQLLLGGWLGIGNFLPYIASFLSYINHASIINQQTDAECTPQLQSLYAYYLSQCNWLISASITGYALLGPVGGQLYIYLQSMRWIAFIGGSTVSIAIFAPFMSNVISVQLSYCSVLCLVLEQVYSLALLLRLQLNGGLRTVD
eukprot:786981_1